MTSIRPTLRTVSLLLRPLPRRSHSTTTSRSTSSVSASEVSHFSSLASSWWDPMGPSRVLHLMNPLRHDFIASCLADGPPSPTPSTAGSPANPNTLHYLDVGCGGGIFAESLARTIPLPNSNAESGGTVTRAASITAIDPTTTLIQIARDHARKDPKVSAHLNEGRFRYVNCTLEDVIAQTPNNITQGSNPGGSGLELRRKDGFDVVTLFEVLEHIDSTASISPLSFLTDCLRLLKPGGWLVGSTIARTWPSFLVNQVIAEAPWPIGVVPKGTHEWRKFVNPDELEAWASEGLMRSSDLERDSVMRSGSEALQGMQWKCAGVVYFPGLGWKFVPGSESWGNYFWAVRRGV
ncbi:S-adenosyl-L-methionine-dependent methyltransferase [Aspergillus cavernicola]|uniref:Ubiquinone biosynthesis O-methyltransferase, mitochondrial n=1 Tax=Aspergillus cavernicola TaxID=176166 RepID=A0ABR4J523_9EURO